MSDGKFYAVVEFEDGLQVIPNNWLSADLRKAVWPNVTNNKRYDKAVQLMEKPEPTWLKHNIQKIYGTYFSYALARRKLKEAEDLSDLTSNTDTKESQKKSRRYRAAKPVESSLSSNDQSNDSFISELPKIPTSNTTTKPKISKTKQTEFPNIRDMKINKHIKTKENVIVSKGRIVQRKIEKEKDSRTSVIDQSYLPASKKTCNIQPSYDNTSVQHTENLSNSGQWFDNEDDYILTSCSDISVQRTENLLNHEFCDNEYDNVPLTISGSNIDVQRTNNLSNHDQFCDDEGDNIPISISYSDITSNKVLKRTLNIENLGNIEQNCNNDNTTVSSANLNNEQRNFQRFVVRKLIDLESKINVMKVEINKNQKLILDKLSNGILEMDENDKIDIFEYLPLKDSNDLEAMEIKLKNDVVYRNQMVN